MMTRRPAFLTLLAIWCCLAVQASDKIPVNSYTFSWDPITWNAPEYQDPDGKKLIDGKSALDKDAKHPHCVWHDEQIDQKPLHIDFRLKTAASIDTIRVFQHRWFNYYGLKDVRVIGRAPDGKAVNMGIITLNQPWILPKGEPHNSVFEIKCTDDTPVNSVKLIFTGTGTRLAFDEIEFYGKAVEAGAPIREQPLDILAKNGRPGLRLYKHGRYLVLENDYSIFAVDPRYGGGVSFAWDKLSKRNFVKFGDIGNSYGPLFQDRFHPGDDSIRDSYLYCEFHAEILKDTPDRKQIRVWGNGKIGVFNNVEISKVYTLDRNSSVLDTDLTITNSMDNVVPLRYGYWFSGGLYSPNSYRRIFPGATRTETHPPQREIITTAFPSGWFGGIDGDAGLAITFPYDCSKELYYWDDNDYQGTIELKMGVYPIKAGSSRTYAFGVAPFSGVGIPDKINAWAAASVNDQSIRLRLFRPGAYTLRIRDGVRKDDKSVFGAAKEVQLKEGAVLQEIPYKASSPLVRIELVHDGEVVFSSEKSDGVYNPAPDGIRLPDESGDSTALNLDFHSKDFTTPHFDWGGKFAVGKPKVLAIFYLHGGIREAVELSARFDMDLTTNFIAGLWALTGHVMSLDTKTCYNELAKKLQKQYDVIIVSSSIWSQFPDHVKIPLLDQVKNGTGLILAGGEQLPTELSAQFTPVEGKDFRYVRTWKNSDQPLAAGLPLAEMPRTRLLRYELKNGASPVVMSENAPLVAQGTLGKGKVFLCAWETRRPNPVKGLYNESSSYLLPFMVDVVNDVDHSYYEYQYALMARLVQAAWGKESGVTAALNASPEGMEASITSDTARKASVRLTLRDKFSKVVYEDTRDVALAAGVNKVQFMYPVPFMTGRHFTDVVIGNDAGALWWGSAVFNNERPSIDTVAFKARVYKPSEHIEGQVSLKGEGTVSVMISDTFGNITAQSTGAAFKLPLADVTTPNAFVIAELRDANGKVLDRRSTRISLFSPPDPRCFHVEFGWAGISDKTPQYLADILLGRFRDTYSLTVNSSTYSNRDFKPYMNSWRDAGIRYSLAAHWVDLGGKFPYDTNKANGPKNELIRKPCLNTPGYQEKLKKDFSSFTEDVEYGVLNMGGPDEASSINNWDGCFCEHCKVALREYLKKEYGTLETLNASWETSFTNWDEVEARTVQEIRDAKCKSFASWVDHRTLNDIRRAECLSTIQRTIHTKYPDMGYSLSGTQDTNPWNAWDWYLLMEELYAFSGYAGEQNIQRLSFAKRPVMNMPWIGYDASPALEMYRIMRALMYGCSGLSIYGGNIYICPDWTLPETGVALSNILKKFVNGTGELVKSSNFAFDPIALHYSPASIKVDWIAGLDLNRKAAVTGMGDLIGDNGYTYAYTAYRQLETEDVGKKHSIIMLPMSLAMSDAEIAGLERFVANGGTLIADMLPGTYDQHGKPRSSRQLLELFGLKAQGEYVKAEMTLTGTDGDFQGLSMPVPGYEKGLVPATAVAQANINGQPMVLVNRHGKGKTIYIGCSMFDKYGELGAMRRTPKNQPMTSKVNAVFNSLIKENNIVPRVRVDGLVATKVLTRTLGPALVTGVVRDITQTADYDVIPHDASISLRQKAHVYDMLEHAYLGHADSFTYRFNATTQALFLLLPYKPTALKAALNGETVTLSLDVPEAGPRIDHIFRIEVKRPDGRISLAHSQLVFGKGTTGTYTFKRPLNSPEGAWTLTATDVATNLKTTLSIP